MAKEDNDNNSLEQTIGLGVNEIAPEGPKKKRSGGKRAGSGRRSILSGGSPDVNKKFDPNTGWPTCYGDRCESPATKLAVLPRQDGSGADTMPMCPSCLNTLKTKNRSIRGGRLTGVTLEGWKAIDNANVEDVPGVDTDIPVHTVNPVEEGRQRKVRKIRDADTVTSAQTRASLRDAHIRALDSNQVVRPITRTTIAHKTAEPTAIPPRKSRANVNVVERDRAGLMGRPLEQTTEGSSMINPTTIEAITGRAGGALAALGTTLARLYNQRAQVEVNKRRSADDKSLILGAALASRRGKKNGTKKTRKK